MIDRLPGGIFTGLGLDLGMEIVLYEGFEAAGVSLAKKDKDTLKMTGVCKFDDKDTANDAVDEIENYYIEYYAAILPRLCKVLAGEKRTEVVCRATSCYVQTRKGG